MAKAIFQPKFQGAPVHPLCNNPEIFESFFKNKIELIPKFPLI